MMEKMIKAARDGMASFIGKSFTFVFIYINFLGIGWQESAREG